MESLQHDTAPVGNPTPGRVVPTELGPNPYAPTQDESPEPSSAPETAGGTAEVSAQENVERRDGENGQGADSRGGFRRALNLD